MLHNSSLASSLKQSAPTINLDYDYATGNVRAKVSSEEASEIYRRLPLHTEMHDYEVTPATQLMNVLAECMKLARAKKLETIATADIEILSPISSGDIEAGIPADSEHDLAINFYNVMFPILDAFADLEEMINRFEDKKIEDLVNALNSYRVKLTAISIKLADNADRFCVGKVKKSYDKSSLDIWNLMLTDWTSFNLNVKTHHQTENTRALLSNHIVKNGIAPLGLFVVKQVAYIATIISQYRKLNEKFPGQEDYIEKSPDCQKIDVLLDDKLAFKESFAGIRFSTAKPISEETITVLRVASGNFLTLKEGEYSLLLNDFIKPSAKADLNAWEKLLCQISGDNPQIVGYESFCQAIYYISAILVATLVEIALTLALRFPATLFVGLATGIFRLSLEIVTAIRLVSIENYQAMQTYTDQFLKVVDTGLDHQHAMSGVGYLRRQRDMLQKEHYKRNAHDLNAFSRAALLSAITSKPKSSLAYLAAQYFKSSYVDHRVVNAYQSIYNFFSIFNFLYERTQSKPSYLNSKIRRYLNEKMGYANEDLFPEFMADFRVAIDTAKLSHETTLPLAMLWALAGYETNQNYSAIIGGGKESSHRLEHAIAEFPRIKPNRVGPAESIMDFPEMLCLEFATLINGVDIKMPLASSLAMWLSFIAWTTTNLNMGGLLPEILDFLSKSFTGVGAVSFVRVTLATFLFWKLTTLGIETIIAAYKLDPHFLEKLYGDPERILLIFSAFLGLGIGMQFFPLLPASIDLFTNGVTNLIFSMYPEMVKQFVNAALSVYPAMANTFILEARVAWGGLIPFNFLELFFLGLKATFLFGALASGFRKPHLVLNEVELAKIIEELNNLNVTSIDRPKAVAYIVRLYNALELPIERNQSQHFYDILSADKAYAELANDLYNQSIDQGSNNLLQILFLLPGVLFSYPYRFVAYVAGSLLESSVMQHGIRKNFCEDATMFTQVLAALCEVWRTFLVCVNQSIKSALALLIGLPLHLSGKYDFASFNKEVLSGIEMHNGILYPLRKPLELCVKAEDLNFMKSGYSMFAHTANTNESSEHDHDIENQAGAAHN